MKDKIRVYAPLIAFLLIVILLMLADDGVFGETIKNMLGWIILIGSIMFLLLCLITNKFKK